MWPRSKAHVGPISGDPYKTYDALIAPDDISAGCGEKLAGYESRFAKIETGPRRPQWMAGVILAASLSLVIKAFA